MAVITPGKTKSRKLSFHGLRSKNIKQSLWTWTVFALFLLPSFLGVVVFYFYPFVAKTIVTSFQKSTIDFSFAGWQNYTNVFSNNAFQDAGKNTFMFAILAVPLAVILAVLLAVLLDAKIWGKTWFRSVFLSPMMVPVASIVLIWQVVFSDNGSLNTFITGMGGERIFWLQSEWSRGVILLLFLWKNLGYNMVIFLSALGQVPKELIESAQMDGGNGVQCFFKIKLAYLYPTLFFVSIMSLISTFKIFREVYLLTGEYPYGALYTLQNFMNNSFKNLEYQKLTAAAVIMSIAMIIIVGFMFFFENRLGKDVEE